MALGFVALGCITAPGAATLASDLAAPSPRSQITTLGSEQSRADALCTAPGSARETAVVIKVILKFVTRVTPLAVHLTRGVPSSSLIAAVNQANGHITALGKQD